MCKTDFPIFQQHPLLRYYDNAATTQKPAVVIDAITQFYATKNAPVHRGIYRLAEEATAQYEAVRHQVAHHLGAQSHEIIFTKGATEGINLVAHAWARHNLSAGDEIVITELEHHANVLPWLELARERNLVVRTAPVDEHGILHQDAVCACINEKTRLVAITHTSNVTGQQISLSKIIEKAHSYGARVLIDAAQAMAHQRINIRELGADFLVFSGHKMYGPTGVGVVYASRQLHDQLQPYQVGGGMVHDIGQTITWRQMPHMLEAGTPPIASVIGLGAAISYLHTVDMQALKLHEAALVQKLCRALNAVPDITVIGSQDELQQYGHIVSFVHKNIHAHDIAAYLDKNMICVRAGHHCVQPLHKKLCIAGTVRVSFGMYNTEDEVQEIIRCLKTINSLF